MNLGAASMFARFTAGRDGALMALLLRVAAVGLGFLVNLVISRGLGASGAGSYFIVVSLATLVGLLGRMGQDTLLVREVAAVTACGQSGRTSGLYRRGLLIGLVGALAGAVAIAALAGRLASDLFHNETLVLPLQIMSGAVVLMALQSVASEGLRGIGWVNASQFLQLVAAPLATLLALWLLPGSPSVVAVVWASVAGFGVAAVLALAGAWTILPRGPQGALPAEYSVSRQLRKGWPLCAAGVLTYLGTWVDTLVLGTIASPDVVGVYTVAARVAALCGVIKVSLAAVVGPRLAAASARGDMDAFRREGLSFARMSAMAGLPLLGLVFVLGEPLLRLFGHDFVLGTWTLRVLLLGYAANYLLGYGGVALSMTRHAGDLAISMLLGLTCSLILMWELVPHFGALGAAIAMSFGTVLTNAIVALLCRKRLAVPIDLFSLG